MSFSKKVQDFRKKSRKELDADLAKNIGHALRQDFGEKPSAIKRIGQLTRAELRAIKNWYEGRNAPSSRHLLILARSSPALLKFMLQEIGGQDLVDAFGLLSKEEIQDKSVLKSDDQNGFYTDKIVSINMNIQPHLAGKLNQRQQWFLELVRQGQNIKASDIAVVWQTNIRSARRDVALLIDKKLIYFAGAKKNGKYELLNI